MMVVMKMVNKPDFVNETETMIAGTSKDLVLAIFNADGTKADLSTSTAIFNMADYSDPDYKLFETDKPCVVTQNKVMVALQPNDTNNLYGKFLYQFTITTEGKVDKVQGYLHIDRSVM